MKKLLLFFACMMIAISSYAQISVASYTDSLGDSFPISLLLKKEKPSYISVGCKTQHGIASFWIKPNDVDKFRTALTALKDKFAEWSNTAKENDIKDARKDVPIKFPKVKFVWGHSTTFVAIEPFKASWILSNPVDMVVCMALVKYINNKYIDEVFSMTFYSPEDVQALIDALSQANIDAAIQKTKNNDLFN